VAKHLLPGQGGLAVSGVDGLYVLDDTGEPRPEPDVRRWSAWLEAHGQACRVARDAFTEFVVVTEFTAVDHNYYGGPPLLWETVVVGGPYHRYLQRYSTRYAAELSHFHVVMRMLAGTFEPYAEEGVAVLRLARAIAEGS
jgi:hypothetical protein